MNIRNYFEVLNLIEWESEELSNEIKEIFDCKKKKTARPRTGESKLNLRTDGRHQSKIILIILLISASNVTKIEQVQTIDLISHSWLLFPTIKQLESSLLNFVWKNLLSASSNLIGTLANPHFYSTLSWIWVMLHFGQDDLVASIQETVT